jgi:hypothetical protein
VDDDEEEEEEPAIELEDTDARNDVLYDGDDDCIDYPD